MRGSGRSVSIKSVSAHTRASTRSGLSPLDKPVRPEIAHLVFERRKRAEMRHAALLVERGDRLGAEPFAPRRAHFSYRHGRIDLPDHGLDQLAALVHFRDDAVGLVAAINLDHALAPSRAGSSPRRVASAIT